MIGLLTENGPCLINDDSNSTRLNPWSWNNEVNMLYIDEPNQVGFSYDIPSNGTTDESEITIQDFSNGVPVQNNSFYVGTFPSQNPKNTANGTTNAARAMWHFAQTWFQEVRQPTFTNAVMLISQFPDYKPNNDAISIFTESVSYPHTDRRRLFGSWNVSTVDVMGQPSPPSSRNRISA